MALAPETAPERASRPDELRSRQREFEEVALVHRERLYHLALGLCRNPPDAEDLVQETLVRAFRHFDRFTPGTNCVAWLAAILRNLFLNQVRRRGRVVLVADEDALEEHIAASWERRGPAVATPEDEFLMSVIDDRRLLEALHRLPRGYQDVIVVAAVEGLSHREIALRCELPIGTVMSRLFRARRLLLKAPMFGQMSAGSGGWRRRMRNGAVVGTRHREFARAAAGCGTASTSAPLATPLAP